jgi:hypothetical protein
VCPKRITTRNEYKRVDSRNKILGIAVACTVQLLQEIPALLKKITPTAPKSYPYCTKKLPLLHQKKTTAPKKYSYHIGCGISTIGA